MRLIDADELIKALNSNCKPELCHDYKTAWCVACCPHTDFEDLIENAPTVNDCPNCEYKNEADYIRNSNSYKELIDLRKFKEENKRPQGKWLCKDILHNLYYCSECRNCGIPYQPFCAWCGADMRGDTDETD